MLRLHLFCLWTVRPLLHAMMEPNRPTDAVCLSVVLTEEYET
jgi:hypothetical protein